MIQLAAAITSRFPQGNEWATLALDGLADGVGPTTLVHGIAEGWYRRGDGESAVLVDTLFVLTDDRLGLGQVGASPAGVPSGAPRWIELSNIAAVDAVDRSPLPLQTIEMELADGTQVCVGWPETFSDALVAALLANAGRVAADADHQLPPELVDATIADDPSALDDLAPSSWVEQEVASPAPSAPRPLTAAIDFLNPTDPSSGDADHADTAPYDVLDAEVVELLGYDTSGGPEAWFAVDTNVDAPPVDPSSFVAGPDAPIPPIPPTTAATPVVDASTDPAATGAVAADSVAADPVGVDPVIEVVAADSAVAVADADADETAMPVEPALDAAPELASAPASTAVSVPAESPPWRSPGMTWPDPLRGVLYLGGHPGYSRKRKNGTMVFSPDGLDVAGSGFQDWHMSIDWAHLDGIEVQGPDEIMFGDNIKIDSTSSALVVSMTDGTRMFFEIRTRRPPSLRSALAPVLLLVDGARTWRAQHPAD